jgi:hypothetical protein
MVDRTKWGWVALALGVMLLGMVLVAGFVLDLWQHVIRLLAE